MSQRTRSDTTRFRVRHAVVRAAFLTLLGLLGTAAFVALTPEACAQEGENPLGLNLWRSVEGAAGPQQISTTLVVFFLITVLSLAPAILVMTTSFTRIIVVLGFLRQAMATQQSPPNQVLVGMALFLTFFIMSPSSPISAANSARSLRLSQQH